MIILLIFFLLNYYLIENLILFCFFESCIVKYNDGDKKNLRGYGNLYLFLICINWLLYIYYIYI